MTLLYIIQSIANCWTNFLSFMLEHFTLSSHSLSDVMRKIFYLCANSYILDSYVKVMFVLSHGIKATKFTKKANNGELILKKGMTQKKKEFSLSFHDKLVLDSTTQKLVFQEQLLHLWAPWVSEILY